MPIFRFRTLLLRMMQFEATERENEVEALDNGLDPYTDGAFRQSGRLWRVLDLRSLVRQPAFYEVAA